MIDEHLRQCGRARQRQQEAEEEGLVPAHAEQGADDRSQEYRAGNLQTATDQDRAAQTRQLTERQFHADGEQQHDDADLGKARHGRFFTDQPDRIGTEHRANDEKSDDWRHLEPLKHHARRDAQRENRS